MTWRESAEVELRRARIAAQEGNDGKVRTCARRAAGVALTAMMEVLPDRQYGKDFMTQLRALCTDPRVPEPVRRAADRLQQRLQPDFSTASVDPVGDAGEIIAYVQHLLG